MKKNWVLAITVLSFLACSSSKKQILVKEYQTKSQRSSVLVVPIDNYFSIEHEEEEFKNMSDQDRRNFDNLFGLIFQDHTNAKVFGIDNNFELNTSNYEQTYLKLSAQDSISFMVPSNEETISFYDDRPEFVLFLQEYFIDFKSFEVSESLSLQSSAGDKNYLFLKSKYMIWDNINMRIAGWGRIEARNNFNNKITREVYLDLVGKLSKEIIQFSPLEETSK